MASAGGVLLACALAGLASLPARARAADTSACSRSNGCGPDGWIGKAVPERLEWDRSVDFGPACDHHDRCYGTWGESQTTCDDRFHTELKAACRKAYPKRGWSQADCYLLAHDYYLAVDLFGGDAFQVAKSCVHQAMHREDRQLADATGGVTGRFQAMRANAATEATRLATVEASRLHEAVGEGLDAAQEAVNEASLYLLLLQGAKPADGDQAAHAARLAELRDLQKRLQELNDGARPGAEQQQRRFDRAAFEARARQLATQLLPPRVEAAAAAVKAARDHQAAIHDRKVVKMGQSLDPTPAELDAWRAKILAAAHLTDQLHRDGSRAILQGCSGELGPLRTADASLRSALASMRPLLVRARALVEAPKAPRPPPPAKAPPSPPPPRK